MKPDFSHLEKYRRTRGLGAWNSTAADGRNGAFEIPYCDWTLRVICSDGEGWDHVSVSLPNRCPTWEEMAFIKRLFFDPEECAMQLHPPESRYRNAHPYCLHLWRPQGKTIPQPPTFMVA